MSDATETPRGFRLSLKFCLLAFVAVGVASGLLGRLFFSNFEIFLTITYATTTVGPFVAAIITIISIGARRKTRSRALIVWGIVLLLMPIVGSGALILAQAMLGPRLSNMTTMPTQQVIEQELVKRIDEPWVWDELESRLNSGNLNQAETESAVKKLISHMRTTKPDGWDQPFHWQDDFLMAAQEADQLSDVVLFDLCDAFYGPKAKVEPMRRHRETESGFDFGLRYGSTWSGHSGLGVLLVWDVGEVRLDGNPIEVRQSYKHGEQWGGRHEGSIPAGDHELSLDVECAYIDEDKLIGLNRNDLPKSRWPKARKQWKQTVTAPLKIFTADEPIVQLCSDPNLSPGPNGGVTVDRFVVQADRDDKKKVVLKLRYGQSLPIALSYDVSVVLNGETIPLGGTWVFQTTNMNSSGSTQLTGRVSALDPSVRSGQVILTPNPSHIEKRPQVEQIWGSVVNLPPTPLERLDLELAGGEG